MTTPNPLLPPAQTEPVVLSVIAPCLNEAENVDTLVDRTLGTFEALRIAAELVLVDDGSTDATWERVLARSNRDQRLRGVRHEVNRGIEAAWRSGAAVSRGRLICLIDADLQNRPEDISKLYKRYIRELPDIVQAVRHPAHGATRCILFSRGLNRLLNFAFGIHLRDSKSGFLLCRRDVLNAILRHRRDYKYFQSFIGAAALLRGFSIAEEDTTFDPRRAGDSFLSGFPVGVSLRIVWELLKFRGELRAEGAGRAARRDPDWPLAAALADPNGGDT